MTDQSPAKIYSGKKYFFAILALIFLYSILTFVVTPPDLAACSPTSATDCFCPTNDRNIAKRNSIIIDTTDPLREGKYDDVERLTKDYALNHHSFLAWMKNEKNAEKTSIFVLSNQQVPDIVPLVQFCRPPPAIALYFSDASQKEIDDSLNETQRRLSNALDKVKESSGAGSSHIVEMLATVSNNASAWSPGGDLILYSDLLENSMVCGQFDSPGVNVIPLFSSISRACRIYVERLSARLQPTGAYPELSLVSLCMLPGKPVKPGLIAFWNELFKNALTDHSAIYSCDPAEISQRRSQLKERRSATPSTAATGSK